MAEVGVTCGFELAGELLEPDTRHFAQIALLQPVFQVPPRLFSQVPPAINLLLDLAEKLADVGPALIEVLVVLAELLRMPLHLGDPLCALLVFIPHLPSAALTRIPSPSPSSQNPSSKKGAPVGGFARPFRPSPFICQGKTNKDTALCLLLLPGCNKSRSETA